MMVMKDVTKKIRSKERMDAENRWWGAELLAQIARKRGSRRRNHEKMEYLAGDKEKKR